ncbi:hypothetical protein EGW08_009794, partial [Elysia chlorotica]
EPPRITEPEKDVEVSVDEFESQSLTCSASGIPKPSITWKRETPTGQDIYRRWSACQHQPNEAIGTGNLMIIRNTSRECGGVYICEAMSSVLPNAIRKFHVKVRFPPEIHLDNDRLSQGLGKDTVLSCTISGFPKSLVYWEFNGKQISQASDIAEKYSVEVYEPEEEKVGILLTIKNLQYKD